MTQARPSALMAPVYGRSCTCSDAGLRRGFPAAQARMR
jgi:hypothetical protein